MLRHTPFAGYAFWWTPPAIENDHDLFRGFEDSSLCICQKDHLRKVSLGELALISCPRHKSQLIIESLDFQLGMSIPTISCHHKLSLPPGKEKN